MQTEIRNFKMNLVKSQDVSTLKRKYVNLCDFRKIIAYDNTLLRFLKISF